MLKQIGIFILLLVAIQSCVIAQAADTTLVLNEFENLDSTKNPFLTQTDTNDYNCNWGGQEFIWSFKCMNEQFRRAQTPIHLSNYLYRNDPTSNNKNAIFYDSLIIADLFQDTEYFLTHWSERTYGYFKGKIIDQNSHYTLCLMLEGYSVGHEYQLISFTNDGHLISKLPIAGTWVGEYETSAIISNKNSFKIKKVKFHWDNSNSELYTATVELSSYIIDDKGKFILKETRN